MKKFPAEFADLLTPRGRRILRGEAEDASALFRAPGSYFVNLRGAVGKQRGGACARLLDEHLLPFLASEERRIEADSISRMKKNYSERLNKTLRFKTAFLQRSDARSYQAAERIDLLRMMRSESFAAFAEAVTGLRLGRDLNTQVICYGHGDYAGPHNDHHPEVGSIRKGFVDFHITFTTPAVAHHYLVYEENGHLSKLVDVNAQGGISIYKLPFWHYTTPLWGKPGREHAARRWLLLGTFRIVGP